MSALEPFYLAVQTESGFAGIALARDAAFPITLNLVPGDHRLISPEHLDMFQRLVQRKTS